jgi:amidase
VKFLSKENHAHQYSPDNAPVLTVATGEIFQLETPSILTFIETFPDSVILPVTGPVEVQGAEPGLTLKIDILKIKLTTGEAAITAIPGKGAFSDRISQPSYKVVTYDDTHVHFSDSLKIPLRPMVGKIGVAPAEASISSGTSGPHGGNMDITEMAEGASVYLPIFMRGAMMAAGDVHALMADGESHLSAVETESVLTLRCDVTDAIRLTHPMLVTQSHVMTVGEGRNLEEAYHIALDDMARLIMERNGLGFLDAVMLISNAADLKINQIVNPMVGVRAVLPIELLSQAIS